MNNGNITDMTLDQMLRDPQCLDIRALGVFWWKTLHGSRGSPHKPNPLRMFKVLLFLAANDRVCRRLGCVPL